MSLSRFERFAPAERPDEHARKPSAVEASEVALLHLSAATGQEAEDAATAVYRQARQGRRTVAVVTGGPQAEARLADACARIGVAAPDPAALREPASALHDAKAQDVSARPLRVALAGCGVVGGGLVARLARDPRFELVGVLVRDPARPRDPAVEPGLLLTDPAALLACEPDVLADCLSDAATGLSLTRAALARGVHVVSAAKQAVGADPEGLAALAESNGATLAYSAAAGGGAPMLETLARARAHGPVRRIEAVLNGTVNFILNRLAAGQDFDAALAQARAAGFAEEDPSADLSGLDASAKLSLLAHAAWGATITPVVEGLTIGFHPGARPVRQLATAERTDDGAIAARITLTPVDPASPFLDLPDEWNALRITGIDGAVFTCRGRGAGRAPTAESVWSDLIDLVER